MLARMRLVLKNTEVWSLTPSLILLAAAGNRENFSPAHKAPPDVHSHFGSFRGYPLRTSIQFSGFFPPPCVPNPHNLPSHVKNVWLIPVTADVIYGWPLGTWDRGSSIARRIKHVLLCLPCQGSGNSHVTTALSSSVATALICFSWCPPRPQPLRRPQMKRLPTVGTGLGRESTSEKAMAKPL